MSATLGSITFFADHAVPWTLVTFRVAGLFMLTQLLTSMVVPVRFKGLLAIMMASSAYALLPVRPDVRVDDVFGLAVVVAGEALIGFVIGAIAATPLLMLEMSGVVSGTMMGLGLARVYNPESSGETDLLGQLMFFLGMGIFVAMGGLESLFAGLIATYERVPPGMMTTQAAPLDLLVGVVASGFELAMRVSAPVVGIVSLILVVLGVLGKTIPQINTMNIGFSVKIIFGLALLCLGVGTMRDVIGSTIHDAMASATGWAGEIRAAR